MSQLDTQKLQLLEGFYRIIGNKSKYWEIRGNIVKQYDPHGLFPESKEMAIEYGDLGKSQKCLQNFYETYNLHRRVQ